MIKKIIKISSILSLIASPVLAQQKDKVFDNWSVYSATIKNRKLCYIVSYPITKTGNYVKRDVPYFMVTSLGSKADEVSTFAGYNYKLGSKVDVSFDKGNTYYMSLTKDNFAWAKESSIDQQIINEMKIKSSMTIKGSSLRGTYSVDRYSLKGFNSAYNQMKTLCK